ncbi:hypothetical protein ACNQKP_08850 [Bdellovibrio bacteriovorus]|uniref:hypothetical protein n=1 Tax=Bdellovibrio bacteriovorus TaxID=959 RepID=UPI003AA9C761
MKKIFFVCLMSFLSLDVVAHENGPGVSNAKVAELAAHRIDRLVTLGKIDASFMGRLDKMEVVVVNSAPVYYMVVVSQTPPTQGAPLQLEISFDDDGKPLSYKAIPGGVAGPDYGWSVKDAVSLSENALHYVLENTNDARVALFDKGLKSFEIKKGTWNGQEVVVGKMTSDLSAENLLVYLTLDGSFVAAEFVN